MNDAVWEPAARLFAYPTGSALYLGCDDSVTTDVANGIITEVTHKFRYTAHGWNTQLNGATGNWETVTIYDTADFSGLGV